MDNDHFEMNNSHLHDAANFTEHDPHLRHLNSQPYVLSSNLLMQLPTQLPGIYTLCGSHCVGKTTLLKQWMSQLLKSEINPRAIAFFSAAHIVDHLSLYKIIQDYLLNIPTNMLIFVIIDDVTTIHHWPKAIKKLEEDGLLINKVLMLSSCYATLVTEVNQHFPRRNITNKTDFKLWPLSFRETILLKHGEIHSQNILYTEIENYLQHGGYIKIINEMAIEGHITDKTLSAYAAWLVKEVIDQNKNKHYLCEILKSVLRHYCSSVTWNALSHELTIDHPKTIGDYFVLLEEMEIVFIQYALLESSLTGAPKKKRKIMFCDPFIYHVIHAWVYNEKNYYSNQISVLFKNKERISKLVEAFVVTQFHRYFPTFYLKAKGEVSLIYIEQEQFWPIEITWETPILSKDLKQLLKYPNSRILTKTNRSGVIEHIRTEPLPLALWQLE